MAVEQAVVISLREGATKHRPNLRVLPDIVPDPNEKPLAPLASAEPPQPPPEPAPWTATAKEWEIWVSKRDAYANFHDKKRKAEAHAAENDLRGVPFS